MRIVGDEGMPDEVFDYTDVTADVIKSYVETYKEHAVCPAQGDEPAPPIVYTGRVPAWGSKP